MNALWKLLSEGHSAANPITVTHLQEHIAEALMRAGQCAMDPETRGVYFKTVAQFINSYSPQSADMTRLMSHLIDVWKSFRYSYRFQHLAVLI